MATKRPRETASWTSPDKGTVSIVQNLMQWPGSIVVVDPKGENATFTAVRRGFGSKDCEGLGQEVHVLDPFLAATVPEEFRSRFNPLDAIDPTHPEAVDLAAMIASAMVMIGEGESKIWDEAAVNMLQGLILHVKTDAQFDGKRNLLTVRALLMDGDQESVELLQKAGETDIASAQALLWEGLRSNPACHGIIARIGATMGEMYATAPKQFQGVCLGAHRGTRFLDSPDMQACMEASNFALSDLMTDPKGMSLYMCLPSRYQKIHSGWVQVMIGLTINQLEATKDQPACGHRVLLCLDEFSELDW